MEENLLKILVLDKFHKSVPKDKEERVKEKVKMLANELEKHNCRFENVAKGFDLRRIEEVSQPIYKFRFNKGERILCARAKDLYPDIRRDYEKSLVLLEYCSHDKQIRTAKHRDFTKRELHEFDEEVLIIEDEENNGIDFSLQYSAPVIIDRDRIEDLFGEEGRFYYLDDEQNACAELKMQGELVLGSAGSGKTTIGVYKLANYIAEHKNEDFRLCYVTFSKRLKEKTEKLFTDIAVKLYKFRPQEFEGKVEFFTLEEHLEKLNEGKYNLITYEIFKDWYDKQKNIKFEALSLWKERRGILQGMIGLNWQYEMYVPVTKFDNAVIDMLQVQRYIELDVSKEKFRLCKELNIICQFIDRHGQLSEEFRKILIQEYNDVISSQTELEENEYDRLSKDYTIFTKEEQEKIKSIFKRYKNYTKSLRKNNFYEEGELVRCALQESKPRYDYMVIDEVQDLTEVQVYYLCQLLKKKMNVFVCGDFHQTINPTFFHAGRIESIFKFLGGIKNFEKTKLDRNYRSSESIVDFANHVAELRRKSINGSADFEYKEKPMRGFTKKPYWFTGDKEQLLRRLIDKSYVLIVVPHEQSKQELIQLIPQLEPSILTVTEAKGIENKYVITYNIISAFKEQWREIMGETKLRSEVHRYYFNVLYVAITRARDVIGMIEDDLCAEMKEWLATYVEKISTLDINALELLENSTLNDLLKRAQEYEENKIFRNAIAEYRNSLEKKDSAFMEEAQRGILRCQIKQEFEKDRDYAKCGVALFELKEYDQAIPYLRNSKDKNRLLQALVYVGAPGLYKEMESLDTTPVRVLIELNDDALMDKFLQYEIQPFQTHFSRVIEKTTNLRKKFTIKR